MYLRNAFKTGFFVVVEKNRSRGMSVDDFCFFDGEGRNMKQYDKERRLISFLISRPLI